MMHSSMARAGVQWNIPVESYLKNASDLLVYFLPWNDVNDDDNFEVLFFYQNEVFFLLKWQYKHFSIQFMTDIQISQTYLKKFIQIW